jgi:trans-aconitate 2-methyltransferase
VDHGPKWRDRSDRAAIPAVGTGNGDAVTRDWDADTYDRLPIPMTRWGETVVDWLDLVGDERVLDAGCGTGRVTALLRDRLPRGVVIALDGSESMLARARDRLGTDRVEFLLADLVQPLPVEAPVDAILSTATLHWIRDHSALFANLAAVLRPGGQLVAQCGGEGNIASIDKALRTVGLEQRKNYASLEATRSRLEAAGFVEVETWLHEEPTPLPPADVEPYLEAICLGDQVEGLTPEERRRLVREVARRMPGPVIDYVRLNIRARRAG